MTNGEVTWIANFIWGIADDVLRDLYVRGKYRDVILPMIVLRRLDAVLEPSKVDVLAMKENLDGKGIVNQEAALKAAAKQPFYSTSKFSLRDLLELSCLPMTSLEESDSSSSPSNRGRTSKRGGGNRDGHSACNDLLLD